jgi:DNA-binding CsgD family transcriptional regulator
MMANHSDDDMEPGAAPRRTIGGRSPGRAFPSAAASQKYAAMFDQFSEREQRILKLVAQGYISKEIAGLESDSENAIDQVIKRARAKCGGISRRELVRAYTLWEQAKSGAPEGPSDLFAPPPQSDHFLADHIPGLATSSEPGPQAVPVHRDDAPELPDDGTTAPAGSPSPYIALHLPVGIGGSGRNDLGKTSSTLAILVIATVSVMFAGAILALLSAADHLQIGH